MTKASDIPSPCVEICDLDKTGQWCLGCGRSLEEIAGWQVASDAQKLAIIEKLPDRLRQLKA